jgi:hypothetical protein
MEKKKLHNGELGDSTFNLILRLRWAGYKARPGDRLEMHAEF